MLLLVVGGSVTLAGLQSTGEAFTMICTSRRIMVAVRLDLRVLCPYVEILRWR